MVEERFFKYLTFERRYSKHTITSYQTDLHQFYAFLHSRFGDITHSEISHFFIRSWIVSLMDKGLDTRSVNRKITALKTYFRFMLRSGLVKENPMLKIQAPRTSKKLPAFIERSKMDTMLNNRPVANDEAALRDICILELFYQTGVRLSELINLKTTNIDFKRQQIKVLGKRNKERIIPLSQNMLDKMQQYKAVAAKNTSEDTFFGKINGEPLNTKYVYRLVKKRLTEVTTQKKRSPHVLRHTFATHMLDNGADINAIKEMLGHSSLAATQVYTHNTIEKLKNIHARAHPRGNG